MMLPHLQIKRKTAGVKDIFRHLMDVSGNFMPPLADRVNLTQYTQKINMKGITFEAWIDDRLVGLVAAYFPVEVDKPVFITNVSVSKEFMGQGVSYKLMSACIQHAVGLNFACIDLEVNEKNVRAVSLYRKLGFKTSERVDGLLRMSLNLPGSERSDR